MIQSDTGREVSGTAIPLPGWAAAEMADIGKRYAKILRDSRAMTIGDIDDLARISSPISDHVTSSAGVRMGVAVAAVAGALNAADQELLGPFPTSQLFRIGVLRDGQYGDVVGKAGQRTTDGSQRRSAQLPSESTLSGVAYD